MLQSKFRQRTDRLNQILKASIRCEVTYNRYTTFWTVPKSVKNADVLLWSTVSLPISYPSFEHLSDLSITDGHLLDTVNFQARPVEHFLYSAWSRFEYWKSHHLVKSDWFRDISSISQTKSVKCGKTRRLAQWLLLLLVADQATWDQRRVQTLAKAVHLWVLLVLIVLVWLVPDWYTHSFLFQLIRLAALWR